MTDPRPAEIDVDTRHIQVDFEDIERAAVRLGGIVHETPVMTSRTVDGEVNARVFFKCENFQRTGAFKIRGAYNTLSQLSEEERHRGVVTYSSGNHAQAAALAGRLLDIAVHIVMPDDAPAAKLAATLEYGANVIPYDRFTSTREEIARQLADETGRSLIPPYDHPQIVAGQGTVAVELFARAGELDMLVVPCGGGGLLSGCALAAATLSPGCRVIGVEPENAADAAMSFRSGVLHRVDNPDTIADGARTPYLGRVTFPLVLRHVHDIVTVSDAAVLRAMRLLWERMKLVVEPTGALATAALLEGKLPPAARIGVVISGGNVDFALVGRWFGTPQERDAGC